METHNSVPLKLTVAEEAVIPKEGGDCAGEHCWTWIAYSKGAAAAERLNRKLGDKGETRSYSQRGFKICVRGSGSLLSSLGKQKEEQGRCTVK